MDKSSHWKAKVIFSVQKALDILNLFELSSPELSVTEIARQLSLPKSTAAGLIATLETNHYIDQNPENQRYRLGLKLLERGAVCLSHLDLRRLALPHMEKLFTSYNETVNLGILDGNQVLYVERLLSTRSLGFHSEVGKREPVHSTALGKAMLAFFSVEELCEFLDHYPLFPITPYTIIDRDLFTAELARVRQRRYAIDDQENEIGGRCLAAPIFNHRGKVVASISISFPLPRLPEELIPACSAQIYLTADKISHELGYGSTPKRIESIGIPNLKIEEPVP
jgi:DNA-binding IclR family transcriptional regulator